MNRLLSFLLFILSFNSFSYEMYFKCNNEKISDINYSSDYEKLLKVYFSGTEEEINQRIKETCRGNLDCLSQLKNIATFAKSSIDAVERSFQLQLEKEKAKLSEAIQKVPELELKNVERLNHLKEQLACQKSIKNLPKDNFQSDYNGTNSVKIYTPYYNNYMYITGCKGTKSSRKCDRLSYESLDYLIQGSVAMGADPYATLAMAAMEATPDSMGTLYLDPIGKFDSMGCRSKMKSNDYDGPDALNSYGTKYVIQEKTIYGSPVATGIKNYFKHNKLDYDPNKKSYFCRDTTNEEGLIQSRPNSNQCCLELPFTPDDTQDGIDRIEKALTFRFSAKILRRQFRDKKDPAFRIQRYNGYTNLMGAAEGVPTWRAGLNYFKDPVYGYQAMDFIINSFMNNPLINNLVKKYSTNLKKSPKSLLCRGKENGVYKMDTDYYHDKHVNAVRYEKIYNKWKSGKKYSQLSSREKNAFDNELYRNVHKMPAFSGNFDENTIYAIADRYISGDVSEVMTLDKQTFINRNLSKSKRKNKDALLAVDYLYRNKSQMETAFDDPDVFKLNKDRMMDEYFKNIYQSQKTIGKVSTYPWRKFTTDELRSLGERSQ